MPTAPLRPSCLLNHGDPESDSRPPSRHCVSTPATVSTGPLDRCVEFCSLELRATTCPSSPRDRETEKFGECDPLWPRLTTTRVKHCNWWRDEHCTAVSPLWSQNQNHSIILSALGCCMYNEEARRYKNSQAPTHFNLEYNVGAMRSTRLSAPSNRAVEPPSRVPDCFWRHARVAVRERSYSVCEPLSSSEWLSSSSASPFTISSLFRSSCISNVASGSPSRPTLLGAVMIPNSSTPHP